jgi:hypothetical protein
MINCLCDPPSIVSSAFGKIIIWQVVTVIVMDCDLWWIFFGFGLVCDGLVLLSVKLLFGTL